MKKVIADIEIGDMKISSASEMAETSNCHFVNIRHELARDSSKVILSQQTRLSLSRVVAPVKSELETKKATGLDNLSSKMLKIAAGVLAPSLAFLFNQSISSGIVPTEWKLARVTPILKKGKRQDVITTTGQSRLFLLSLRCSKE